MRTKWILRISIIGSIPMFIIVVAHLCICASFLDNWLTKWTIPLDYKAIFWTEVITIPFLFFMIFAFASMMRHADNIDRLEEAIKKNENEKEEMEKIRDEFIELGKTPIVKISG